MNKLSAEGGGCFCLATLIRGCTQLVGGAVVEVLVVVPLFFTVFSDITQQHGSLPALYLDSIAGSADAYL